VFLPGADTVDTGAVTGTYWPYRYQTVDAADTATRRRSHRYVLVQSAGDMAHPRALVQAGQAVEATHLLPRLTPGQRYGTTLGELSALERTVTATSDAARLLIPVPAWNPMAVDAVWENTSTRRRISAVC